MPQSRSIERLCGKIVNLPNFRGVSDIKHFRVDEKKSHNDTFLLTKKTSLPSVTLVLRKMRSKSSSPHRLAWPRTPPFHGGDGGSNPPGDVVARKGVTEK